MTRYTMSLGSIGMYAGSRTPAGQDILINGKPYKERSLDLPTSIGDDGNHRCEGIRSTY